MGYPEKEDEMKILMNKQKGQSREDIKEVVSKEELKEVQRLVRDIEVGDAIKGYIVDISRATRKSDKVKIGLSPRGSLAMMKASQVVAAMSGRDYDIPDDVKAIVYEVALHRLICKNYSVLSNEQTTRDILSNILAEVPVPIEEV